MSDSPSMHRQVFDLFCTRLIYTGMSRAVWECDMIPDCVIKVEEQGGMFQNVMEWETWKNVKDTPLRRWFAECVSISPNGSVLVMRRTRPAADGDYPEKMPIFLNDFKRRNYGLIGKDLVCHDYGISNLMDWGRSKRMVKANWTDAA